MKIVFFVVLVYPHVFPFNAMGHAVKSFKAIVVYKQIRDFFCQMKNE